MQKECHEKHKNVRSGSVTPDPDEVWEYYEQMLFVAKYLENRHALSSLNSNLDDNEAELIGDSMKKENAHKTNSGSIMDEDKSIIAKK